MKRILTLISVFALLLTACEGPQGPPGFDGFDGVNFVGQSFERTVDFTSANNYFNELEIPLDIELFDTDMVLVYRLVGTDNDGFDIWRLLPEIVYTENGDEFQYSFDHNFDFVDVYLYAPPSFDLESLSEFDRLNKTFRVVILPVDFINSTNLNLNDINAVMNYVQLN